MALALLGAHHGRHGVVIFPIIVLLLIIFGIWMVTSRTRQRTWRRGGGASSATPDIATNDNIASSSAERILSERFAKGEISLDEYRACVVALRESPRDTGANP